jgi:hypothetical protein
MENKLYPIFYNNKINLVKANEIMAEFHLQLSSINSDKRNKYLNQNKQYHKYYLSPYPYTNTYRDSLVLSLVNEN